MDGIYFIICDLDIFLIVFGFLLGSYSSVSHPKFDVKRSFSNSLLLEWHCPSIVLKMFNIYWTDSMGRSEDIYTPELVLMENGNFEYMITGLQASSWME